MRKINTIVLIDDSDSVNLRNSSILEDLGYVKEIKQFTSATNAISYIASKQDKDSLPDIIFLDISMPDMDGFQFLEEFLKLKQVEAAKNKSVVVITSSYLDFNSFTKANNYSDYEKLDHIKKPMDRNDIENLFEKHFGPKNLKEKNDRVFLPSQLSEKSFKRLLPYFIKEILFDFHRINEELTNKDYPQVRVTAHKIKGTAATYGAALIQKCAIDVQLCSDDFKEQEKRIKALGAVIEKTIAYSKIEFGVAPM